MGQFELVTIPEWLTESGEPIFNLSISQAAGASSQTPMLESMLTSRGVASTSAEPGGQVNTSQQVGHNVIFFAAVPYFFTFLTNKKRIHCVNSYINVILRIPGDPSKCLFLIGWQNYLKSFIANRFEVLF